MRPNGDGRDEGFVTSTGGERRLVAEIDGGRPRAAGMLRPCP
jgi:hypothetical protein